MVQPWVGLWEVIFKHTFWEGNRVDDWSVNLSVDQNFKTHSWERPPSGVDELLSANIMGVTTQLAIA